jgi:hypothetical protein
MGNPEARRFARPECWPSGTALDPSVLAKDCA